MHSANDHDKGKQQQQLQAEVEEWLKLYNMLSKLSFFAPVADPASPQSARTEKSLQQIVASYPKFTLRDDRVILSKRFSAIHVQENRIDFVKPRLAIPGASKFTEEAALTMARLASQNQNMLTKGIVLTGSKAEQEMLLKAIDIVNAEMPEGMKLVLRSKEEKAPAPAEPTVPAPPPAEPGVPKNDYAPVPVVPTQKSPDSLKMSSVSVPIDAPSPPPKPGTMPIPIVETKGPSPVKGGLNDEGMDIRDASVKGTTTQLVLVAEIGEETPGTAAGLKQTFANPAEVKECTTSVSKDVSEDSGTYQGEPVAAEVAPAAQEKKTRGKASRKRRATPAVGDEKAVVDGTRKVTTPLPSGP